MKNSIVLLTIQFIALPGVLTFSLLDILIKVLLQGQTAFPGTELLVYKNVINSLQKFYQSLTELSIHGEKFYSKNY